MYLPGGLVGREHIRRSEQVHGHQTTPEKGEVRWSTLLKGFVCLEMFQNDCWTQAHCPIIDSLFQRLVVVVIVVLVGGGGGGCRRSCCYCPQSRKHSKVTRTLDLLGLHVHVKVTSFKHHTLGLKAPLKNFLWH